MASRGLRYVEVTHWDFKHLEVVGLKCPSSPALPQHEIPQRKLEIRRFSHKGKESPDTRETRHPLSEVKRESLLFVRPPKQNATIKVALPEKKTSFAERNCVCTCEDLGKQLFTSHGTVYGVTNEVPSRQYLIENNCLTRDVEFAELLATLMNYDKGIRKEASTAIRSITTGFKGNTILSEDQVLQVLKMMQTDSCAVKEGVLMMITKLCASTLNVKKFLESGITDELTHLMTLGETAHVQTQAVFCLSKVVEKSEHAKLWLPLMTSSEIGALIGLLGSDQSVELSPLQQAVLHAVRNLASYPDMAKGLLENGIESVTRLTTCKNTKGEYIGIPEEQGLAAQVLTNLISHDSSLAEAFLSNHDNVIGNIVDLLQYSPCLQQQEAARLLAILACHQPGIAPMISHNTVEHLLWAITCSHCRCLREQASRALRNISARPDRAATLSAINYLVANKSNSTEKPSLFELDSSAPQDKNSTKPLRHRISPPSPLMQLGASASDFKGNVENAIGELTSVLSLAFKNDTVLKNGLDRQFLPTCGPGTLFSKGSTDFSGKKNYVSSLKVLTNVLVVMLNVLSIADSGSSKTEAIDSDTRKLNNVAVMIKYGGLKFLENMRLLSDKLLKANPPSFHTIDVSCLSPKEITASLKNTRRDLIFQNASRKRKECCKRYPEFGFEPSEIDFVKEAVCLLSVFAKTTAPDFDPSREDMEALITSRSKVAAKKHISFQRSALMVRNALKATKSPGGRKLTRSTSAFSLTRSVSQASTDTAMTSKPSQASSNNQDQSEPLASGVTAHDAREMMHFVKESLLNANLIPCLAPWITCGVYDIQVNVLKIIRYLLHWTNSSSTSGSVGVPATPKEAWSSKVPQPRRGAISQRFSTLSALTRNGGNTSKHLGITCVRHVIQHCGAYLLDSLGPPVPPSLGKASLMVIREAVINGESDARLKIVKLGCFSRVIEFIRSNEGDESLQALGIVVVRILVGNNLSLKQLFLAHGGMNMIMALHEYKDGVVKDEAALTLLMFRRGGSNRVHRRAKTAEPRIRKRHKSLSGCEDIWEQVGVKWKQQDEVVKILQKFNIRY